MQNISRILYCLMALLGVLASAAAVEVIKVPSDPVSTGAVPTPAARGALPVAIPGFWDPKRRPESPDLARITQIRFMTEVDYPPFNYAGPDGSHLGFNIDFARMICEELRVTCTIQMRRFDTLIDALAENRGDAVIASIAVTPQTRGRVDFTDPYYRTPARFVARADAEYGDVRPENLEGRKVAVVGGSAHEAYLKVLFTGVELKPYPTLEDARKALRSDEVDLLFADGISNAYWLNGSGSEGCCKFVGGPFTESRYFGEGVGIAVRRGNDPMRLALNWAMFKLWEKGRFSDLWLRYFPINPF